MKNQYSINLNDYIIELCKNISVNSNDLKESSYKLSHTESYIAVSLLNLKKSKFHTKSKIIDWNLIKATCKIFIENLFSQAKLIDKNNLNEGGKFKVVILFESIKECCSICKASIYLINKLFKSVLKDNTELYSFFRYTTPLNPSISQTSNNNTHGILNFNNLLTEISTNLHMNPLIYEKEFDSVQYKVEKICISRFDKFISGGEYFDIE